MGGECKVFIPAEYQILGRTRWDQDWIDQTIESGVAACGWPRPKERPTNWDQAVEYAGQVNTTKPTVRQGVFQRLKTKLKRKPKAVSEVVLVPRTRPIEQPVVQQTQPVPYLQPQPVIREVLPSPVPVKKRSDVDELLGID